jgi:DNA-binding IclR family transcriptional regulator
MANNRETASTQDTGHVKSVRTLFSILELLKENEGTGVTDLSKELDMSKGAVHRYLRTLIDEGYAVTQDDEYHLSLRFLDYGSFVRHRYRYNDFVRPKVQQLAAETGERSQYLVEEHGRGVYLHRERGQNAVQTDARVGKIVYLHTTAAGKAILSQLPTDTVDEIVDEHGLHSLTDQTITSRDRLAEELETIREQGYAINQEEHVSSLYAVGVPVIDANGNVLGGLSVSGPANRFKDRIKNKTIQQLLLGTVEEIELNLNYS